MNAGIGCPVNITLLFDDLPTVTHQSKKIIYVRTRNRSFPKMADTPELEAARALYARELSRHKGKPLAPLQGYLEMELWMCWKWNHPYENWRIAMPDWDNAAKTFQDILVKTGYILHDNQVVRACVNKIQGPKAGIKLQLRLLPDLEQWEQIQELAHGQP